MEVNEEKRRKFIDYAEKRVNNVMHDIAILEPMARSNAYDFTKNDVEEMFNAMQKSLDNAKEEYNKKFEEKARSVKKSFSFGQSIANEVIVEPLKDENTKLQESSIGMPDETSTENF